MNYLYHRLAALGMAAAALSSCSRSAYTFNPNAPAYLGTTQAVAIPKAPATEPVVAVPGAPVIAAPAITAAPAPSTPASPTTPTRPTPVAEVATLATTATHTPTTKPTLVQRLALKKVMKQLARTEARQQNTASVAKTAAKGSSLTVAIVGLAALVVGLIVSSGLLIVLGSIVLAVGIVLLVLSIL